MDMAENSVISLVTGILGAVFGKWAELAYGEWSDGRKKRKKQTNKVSGEADTPYVPQKKSAWISIGIPIATGFLCAVLMYFWGAPYVTDLIFHPGPSYVEGAEVSVFLSEEGGGSGAAYPLRYPECVSWEDGMFSLTDGGDLVVLENGNPRTVPLGGYEADLVRIWKSDLYVLTKPVLNERNEYSFRILRVRGDETREMCEAFFAGEDVLVTRITDFVLSSGGDTLWFVKQDLLVNEFVLEKMSYSTQSDTFENETWFADLQYDISALNRPMLALGEQDTLYITAPEDRVVLRIRDGRQEYEVFAGSEEDRGFDDTPDIPILGQFAHVRFDNPTSLAVSGDFLYVLDGGSLRRISLKGMSARSVKTIKWTLELQGGGLRTLAADGQGGVFLTDPETHAVYQISIT